MSGELSEESVIRLRISSWYHVSSIIAAMVACVVGFYFAVNASLKAADDKATAALAQGVTNAADIRTIQTGLIDMRGDLRELKDDVKWFRQQYTDDREFLRPRH